MRKNFLRYTDAYVQWKDPKLFEKIQYQCGLPVYVHIGDSMTVRYECPAKPDTWIQADGKVLPIRIREEVTDLWNFHLPKKTLLSLTIASIIR